MSAAINMILTVKDEMLELLHRKSIIARSHLMLKTWSKIELLTTGQLNTGCDEVCVFEIESTAH